MDIYCPRCSEPWDIDSIHEAVLEKYGEWDPTAVTRQPWGAEVRGKTVIKDPRPYEELFNEVRQEFRRIGCAAMDGGTKPTCGEDNSLRSLASATLVDVLGDDIDGVASLLDDFEYGGMLD